MTYNRTGLLDQPERWWKYESVCSWSYLLTSIIVHIFVCLIQNHSHICQYLSVFVTFNWPRMTSGKKYWSSSPVLLYFNDPVVCSSSIFSPPIISNDSIHTANQFQEKYNTANEQNMKTIVWFRWVILCFNTKNIRYYKDNKNKSLEQNLL